jgi:bifunctional ADP-heptose synthase (sugar kinase/adenylyltransferase)|tara:strand:+ start:1573 stop:1824 length:252 start_codon:yes stop_codon:yes gene_type:complete
MSEEIKQEEIKAPTTKMDEARAIVERMEKANEESKKILQKNEELMVEKTLSGRSEAGQAPVKEPEETAKEYAAKVMSGEVKGK